MAKRETKSSNKSAAIREFITANPDAGPTEISRALNEREGWKISPAYVSTIKSKSGEKKSGGRKRRGRRPGGASAMAAGAGAGASNGGSGRSSGGRGVNEQALIQAKKMVDQVGGIETAKAAIELLGRLTS